MKSLRQIEYEKEQAVQAEKLKQWTEDQKQKELQREQEWQAKLDAIHKSHPGLISLLDEYLNTLDDDQYHESWETRKDTASGVIENLKVFLAERIK